MAKNYLRTIQYTYNSLFIRVREELECDLSLNITPFIPIGFKPHKTSKPTTHIIFFSLKKFKS